ncbi:MAG: hypothetical protein F4080_16605 [Holophagales bacterium]|nr:hypothetical protein [Holophagales bacterium]
MKRGGERSLYVVLLQQSAWQRPQFRKRNRRYWPITGKPCLYVGETGLEPERRFKRHKNGVQASRFVKRYGQRLLGSAPVPASQARDLERKLAEKLQKKGYAVWWN